MYPVQQQRPTGVTLLVVLMIINGVLWLAGAFVFAALLAFFVGLFLVCFAVFAIIAVFYFIVAWGLWTLQPWARTAAIILAILSLFNVPIGTIIGIIVLIYLFQPEIKAAFGEMPAPMYGAPYAPYAPPGYAPPPAYPPQQYPPQQPGYQQPSAYQQQPAYQPPPAQAPPAAAPPAGGKCRNCGSPINPGVAFCPNCGSRVT